MPLVINGKNIHQLSGPVSITILKPKKDFYNILKKKSIHAPIFILFGDIHFSSSNQCDDNSKQCHKIYDNSFLKTFDGIHRTKYPVDFFIEGFLHLENKLRKLKPEERDQPIPMLKDRLHVCYKKELRNTDLYKELCPTNGVRWHSADIRHAIDNPNYNFESFIDKFSEVIEGISLHKKVTVKLLKEIISMRLLDYYMKEDIIHYLHILKKGLSDTSFADDFIDEYNSLVMKQVYKMPYACHIEMWKQMIKEYIVYNITTNVKRMKTKMDEKLPTLLCKYFETDNEFYLEKFVEYVNKHKDYLEKYNDNFLEFNAIFLDLYMLTRSFKKPDNDINSFVSISYFGKDHCNTIKHFLTKIMKTYDIVYDHSNFKKDDDEKSVSRCVKIEPIVSVDDILREYGYN
jgi:hypothetical protein